MMRQRRADSPYPGMKNEAGYLFLREYDPEDSPVDPALELTDPTPDIRQLFREFNDRFFEGRLRGVEVMWSSKMTSTSGCCTLKGPNGLCCIKLSEPLLKVLPRRNLVETLLHEMIHAYLFVCKGERYSSWEQGHGPSFHKHMRRINRVAGTAITARHRYHKAVAACRQHWFRCDGPCRLWRPCACTRRHKRCPPWPVDEDWRRHKDTCGGTFRKQRAASSNKERGSGNNKSQ